MAGLCWSYVISAYGLTDVAGGPDDLFGAVLSDWSSVTAGIVGGTLTGVAIVLVALRRADRQHYARYRRPTCGDRAHLHLARRTTGGARVYICGPPYHHTCGDDSHPHVHAMTTAGEPAFMCVTPELDSRYRKASLIHRVNHTV